MPRPSRTAIATGQAVYYGSTALAPFISRTAFERITGPKREWWLVLTISALVGAIAAALAASARNEPGKEMVILGAGTAAGMASIDIIYAAQGRISPVYLLDAAIQIPLGTAWLLAPHANNARQYQ
jgi:hypothetical protein